MQIWKSLTTVLVAHKKTHEVVFWKIGSDMECMLSYTKKNQQWVKACTVRTFSAWIPDFARFLVIPESAFFWGNFWVVVVPVLLAGTFLIRLIFVLLWVSFAGKSEASPFLSSWVDLWDLVSTLPSTLLLTTSVWDVFSGRVITESMLPLVFWVVSVIWGYCWAKLLSVLPCWKFCVRSMPATSQSLACVIPNL